MHLHDLMGWPGPMTHLQFLCWCEWRDEEMNRPGLTEHYLMQVAAEVRATPSRVWGKDPGVKLDSMKIPFVRKETPPVNAPEGFPAPATKDSIAQLARAALLRKLEAVKPAPPPAHVKAAEPKAPAGPVPFPKFPGVFRKPE